jgi:multiple sugar transport system permease protein
MNQIALKAPAIRFGVNRRRFNERVLITVFFYPAFFLVVTVSFFPLFYALRQSFHASDYLELGSFVGIDNYVEAFRAGGALWFIWKSVTFVLGSLAVAMPIGVGLALVLSRGIRFGGFFRTILLFPWVVSQLVNGLLWTWFLNGRLGPVGSFLQKFGIELGSPLTDPALAMPALIVTNAWHGYPLIMVFTLAALQTVPSEVTEAAKIDASSDWNRFWSITFPLVKNPILVGAVLTSLNTFNNVTLVLIMTGGGPVGETDVLAIRVFKEAFQFYRMDTATTLAVLIFSLNILFSFFYIRILRGSRS